MKSEFSVLVLMASAIFLASCMSIPQVASQESAPLVEQAVPVPEEFVAVEEPPMIAAIPAPEAMMREATRLRKLIVEQQLNKLLPEDYASAETDYARGSGAFGTDNAIAAEALNDATAGFSSMINRGLPLLAESARNRAQKLKEVVQSKNANVLFSKLFLQVDAEFAKGRAAEESVEYLDALAHYGNTSKLYDTLYKLCEANGTRNLIVSRDFAKWDPSNWELAENKYAYAQDFFQTNTREAWNAADEAVLRYSTVKTTAINYYAADRKGASQTSMENAQSIKAEVAVKKDYEQAMLLFQEAETAYTATNVDSAGMLYAQAAVAFDYSYTSAKQKMDYAQSELDELDVLISAATE